ncbi:UvrD-helicase domain-containing protein [Vibrio astriarenae]|uniref:DNA 3'-5' helicase n=1 Tax=Vibrio astriarenae TaxID=1481923 RepID=A0A7Z2T6T7_9VIBR|nr:UvrD-helicase domain-containing protein [Vibrio astriarenae]QIA65397.1 UvrD-helicase domain-containing protein [Vibrio astriarenae]
MTNNAMTDFAPLTLIKAGAGAGKTYQIQQTLVEWIEQGHVQPNKILAVTFTEAAAQEMKDRIKQALIEKGLYAAADQIEQAQISTIHSFGLSILERFSYEQGLSAKPRQLSENEQKVLISLALNDVRVIDPILDSLELRGYEAGWSGNAEGDVRVRKLQEHVKAVFDLLQRLPQEKNEALVQRLIEQASSGLSDVYQAQSTKEDVLNQGLLDSVRAITSKYEKKELLALWGATQKVSLFVEALYQATPELISRDWKFWLKLERLSSASKIMKKAGGDYQPNEKNDGQLAFDVWSAVDKLAYHKGPLRTALETVEILLNGANEALQNYQSLKAQSSLIDYTDMVSTANTLLSDKQWLEEIANKYDCLIIDEFQDTNPQQFDLLWKVSKAGLHTLIVGDLKQSIMGFQGSDSHLYASLLEQYPNCVKELTNNWRSASDVMTFVNQLGHTLFPDQYHSLTAKSGLQSSLKGVHKLEFSSSEWCTAKGELSQQKFQKHYPNAVADHIKELLDNQVEVIDRYTKQPRAIRPSDIAVLAKTHAHLDKFANALDSRGLLYKRDQQGKSGDNDWFSQWEVRYLMSALNYLANPNDREAKLSLKVYSKEASLEKSLQDVIEREENNTGLQSDALDRLIEVQDQFRHASTCQLVTQCAQTLGLIGTVAAGAHQEKQRHANILKLAGLAEEFEQTHSETLQSQGVYGRSLSSFLLWLTVNKESLSVLPNVDNDNKNAVNLVTWHKSKGLEWPIVVVAQLDEDLEAKYPTSKLRYNKQSTQADSMLDDAWINIVPKFAHSKTVEKFDNDQADDLDKQLKNLCYVALTRAREQIILPWCDLPNRSNNMLSLIRDLDYSNALVTKAPMPQDPVDTASVEPEPIPKSIKSWDKHEQSQSLEAEINPSTIASNSLQADKQNQQFNREHKINLNAAMDLNPIRENYSSAEVGTWLHQCYQVLLSKPEYATRLWNKLPAIAQQEILCAEITAQISSFKEMAQLQFGARDIQSEVPFLAKHESGAVVSGVVDCLVETEDGLIIIDHKSDEVMSAEAFEHHCHQLTTYAKYLGYTKPVVAIGVNWLREGQIWLLGNQSFSLQQQVTDSLKEESTKIMALDHRKNEYSFEELASLIEVDVEVLQARLDECLSHSSVRFRAGKQLVFVENKNSGYRLQDLATNSNLLLEEFGHQRDNPGYNDYEDEALLAELICNFAIDEDNEGVFQYLLDGIDPYALDKA